MNRKSLLGAIVVTMLFGVRTFAQDAYLAELYGQGVHAFFAKDYPAALEFLDTAVEQGSKDPRVFYFRGLVHLSQEKADQAELNFEQGSALELSDLDRYYNVGRALQRVQGNKRLAIEKHRQKARLAVRMKQVQREQARYERLKRNEAQVLRNPNRPPVAVPPVPTGDAADPTDPFGGEDLDLADGEAVEVPADKPEEPVTDPAEDAEDDPFGADADEAAGGEAAADEEMEEEDDLFGDEDAGDDPFGADADEAAGGEAAADEEMEEEDDLFGDEDAGDDPFGAERDGLGAEPQAGEPPHRSKGEKALGALMRAFTRSVPGADLLNSFNPSVEVPAADAGIDPFADDDAFGEEGGPQPGTDPFGAPDEEADPFGEEATKESVENTDCDPFGDSEGDEETDPFE